MKIRNDFVTNSSSSSFIIAKHKDCTYEELKVAVMELKKDIEDLIVDIQDDIYGDSKEIKHALIDEDYAKAAEIAIEIIAKQLFDYCESGSWSSTQLDNWCVESGEFSNEDCDLFCCFMYDTGSKLKCEHFKIK